MAGERRDGKFPYSNYFATTDPGVSNDDTEGYCIGSMWCNRTGKRVWLCIDNTTGLAIWVQIITSAGTFWAFRAKTTATSGYPGNGYVLWDNATQTSAAHLILAHLTDDGVDIDYVLALLATNTYLILQDQNDHTNYQKWQLSGSPVNTNGGTSTSYWTVPVTLITSGGTGTTGFPNNHGLVIFVVR